MPNSECHAPICASDVALGHRLNPLLPLPLSSFQVLPVLDLLDGIVVRGVGGRRNEYRPVESVLSTSAQPLNVARAFRERLGLTTLYVADLDGILHQRPNLSIFRTLSADGFNLWIDAGSSTLDDARTLLNAGASNVVVGLETLPGFQCLETMINELSAEQIVFSLDLKSGKPLFGKSDRPDSTSTPLGIARAAINLGVTQMIVLDLASVGEQRGPSTLDLCRSIRQLAPNIRLFTGGGVRNAADLRPLDAAQIDGVLLATALHNGQIGVEQVSNLRTSRDVLV